MKVGEQRGGEGGSWCLAEVLGRSGGGQPGLGGRQDRLPGEGRKNCGSPEEAPGAKEFTCPSGACSGLFQGAKRCRRVEAGVPRRTQGKPHEGICKDVHMEGVPGRLPGGSDSPAQFAGV